MTNYLIEPGLQTYGPHPLMIPLTRFNGSEIYVNPDLIWMIEATPDTVVTLTNGEKLLVKESPTEITDRYVALKQRIAVRTVTQV
jgi:flagellar protein FlbD